MRTLIKNCFIYDNKSRKAEPLDMLCENGNIVTVAKRGELDGNGADVIDACGATLIPGFIDVHTHGRSGYDFVSCDGEALHVMAKDYAKCGVTTVMPTLASAPYDKMLDAARAVGEFSPADDEASYCGVHFEGRFLNAKKRGAHAEELLAPLDASELDSPVLKALPALHISAAYELDVDASFMRAAKKIGATMGLGHTNATFLEARRAESEGVTAFTHLYNAMPALHHREGGAICASLTGDSYAELICDGIHIAPEMVKLAYMCKRERLALISDSMEATGCADGEYSIAGLPVTVKDGKALNSEGVLAGSTLTLDRAVQNLADFCKIPLGDAIICATEAPAREMGIFDSCGSLEAGKRADVLFVDTEKMNGGILEIEKIMLRGRLI